MPLTMGRPIHSLRPAGRTFAATGLLPVLLRIVVSAGFCTSASAQIDGEQFVIDHLTIQDGLPVNHTNSLLQTEEGYLWIASFGGLVRYDGRRFVTFAAGNTPDIPSDRITMVFPGEGDVFWFVTEQLDVVRVSPGRFDYVQQFDGNVWSFYTESDTLTWIGTSAGLFQYLGHPKEGNARLRYVGDPELAGAEIRHLQRDRNGVLWLVNSRDNSIWHLSPAGWRKAGSLEGARSEVTSRLFEDRRGNLWAGGKGLFRVRPGVIEQVAVEGLPLGYPLFSVVAISEDPAGSLLLFTTHGPYVVRDGQARSLFDFTTPRRDESRNNITAFAQCPDGRLWTHFEGTIYNDERPVASLSDHIGQLVCDRESNLWVIGQGGLFRFRRAGVLNYGEAEGLSVGRATSIYQDQSGGMLITGLFSEYDRLHNGRIAKLTLPDGGGPFFQDRDGNLWSGTARCQTSWIQADGSCTRFEKLWPGPGTPLVRAIHEDRRGTLWFGLLGGLVWLKDGQWNMSTAADGVQGRSVRYILESRSGRLYFATAGSGIATRLPSEEAADGFSFLTTEDGLSSNNIRGLYEDLDGSLWIATEDRGLNHYDPETGAITVVRQRDGLYSDGLHQVMADDYGRLWMSSNQGIFWIRREELRAFVQGRLPGLTSTYYRERDGMRIREANGGWQNSALKARDGRLWFATQAGASVIDPALVDRDLPPPTVVIEDLETGDVMRSLAGQTMVRLRADERTFRVAYTAINFTSPTRMRFRYMLSGYEDIRVEAGNRREATYTQVPAGTYELQVWASNGDGIWTGEPATMTITVAPFFYEQAVFRAFGAILLIGLGWLLLTLRTRAHTRQRKELERLVGERTEDLRKEKQRTEEQGQQLIRLDRMKTRFFTDISHEFRTPLTLTIGPLEDVSRDPSLPAQLRQGVELALTNSRRILRLINQLLDVARLEAGEMRLSASQQDLAGFVAGVAQQFVGLLERKGVYFRVDVPATPVLTYFDPEKLEQVIVNLLSNAFKFTPEGGAIHVGVIPDEARETVKILVRDTGAGISPEVLPHIFDRFYQASGTPHSPHGSSGIGLSLVHDLVALHKGRISVDSTPRFGSTFTISLPLGRDHLADDQIETRTVLGRPQTGPSLEVASLESYGDGTTSAAVDADPNVSDLTPQDLDDRFTVLIADDSADIRAYVRNQMETRYRVLEASNGREALEIVRLTTPDLVVTDVMMPELDGMGLLAAMRADRETDFIPIVMLTAKATEEDLLGALELGADAYLTKPFSVRELQIRIDGLITQRRRLRERYATCQETSDALSGLLAPAQGISVADSAFLSQVNTAIAENLSEESFDIQELASLLRVSRNTLHRRLRTLVGLPPSEYLRRARLERATCLLDTQEWNVSEVAYAVGFKSVSYFSQCFKEEHGVTPSSYMGR